MVVLREKIALSQDDRSLSEDDLIVSEDDRTVSEEPRTVSKEKISVSHERPATNRAAHTRKKRSCHPLAESDKRETLIRTVAESVDAKAKMVGEELFAKYEHTRAYRSAVGAKAAKTRKKNADAMQPKVGAPSDGDIAAKPA